MRRLPAPATALTALVLAASACGGDGDGPSSGADVAPASSAAFVALNTDFDGEQWQTAERLLARFPGADGALRDVLRKLGAGDLDLERDVKPAVGPEVDLVVLEGGDDADGILLTQPRDAARFRALVAKSGEPAVTEEIDGWWAAAPSRDVLDRFKRARKNDSLAESDRFGEAMDDLPDDALARVYVNGERLREADAATEGVPPDARRLLECAGGEGASSLGLALVAEDGGVRVRGTARGGAFEPSEGAVGEVAERIGSGALAYVSLHGLGEYLRDSLRCAADADEDLSRQLAQLELVLGVSLEEDVLPLFEGETALAVYPGGGTPTTVLVTRVENESRARATVDKVAERASGFLDGVTVGDVRLDELPDVRVRRVTVGGERELYYAAANGMLVLASGQAGILAAFAPADALATDAAFSGAADAANAPDDPASVAYVDVAEAVEAIARLGDGGDAAAQLAPLRSLFLWGEAGDDTFTFEGFLEID